MANGTFITKQDGKTMVDAYQNQYPTEKKAHMYDKGLVQQILDQQDCDGIRIYHGKQSSGDQCLVIVGVKANGDDMTDGLILEFGSPCPDNCPTSSYFNS